MANGHLGTRGAILGKLLLGWVMDVEEYLLAIAQPALYYRFEESSDFTGPADFTAARPGVYNGTVSYQQPGPSPGAVAFASGAYVNSTGTPLNIANGSISFWYRCETLPTDNTLLVGLIDSATVRDKTFALAPSGVLTFTINGQSLVSSALTVRRWHNVTATFSSTQVILYVDGIAVSTQTRTATSPTFSNSNVYVGNAPSSATFPGQLAIRFDELVFWDGTIVQDYQALGIFNTGRNALTSSNALVTSEIVEVANSYNPNARVSNVLVELANSYNPNARVSNIVIEVVRQVTAQDETNLSQVLSFTQLATNTVVANTGKTLTQNLVFAQTATVATTNKLQTTNQNLAFTQTVSVQNVGHGIAQTLAFNQSIVVAAVHKRSLSDNFTFTQNAQSSGNKTLTLAQTLALTQTASGYVERLLSHTLSFADTASYALGHVTTVIDTYTFSERTPHSIFAHLRATYSIAQAIQLSATATSTCDSGTLGDTALGNYTLGTDCGEGGPNGHAIQTYSITDTLSLKKIRYQKITDKLLFTGSLQPGPTVRQLTIRQSLTFNESGIRRQIPIGNGGVYEYNQSPATATVVRSHTILVSRKGAIVLPSAEFDDSVGANNSLTVTKVMSRKTYTYIRRTNRETLKYTFIVGRPKSLELRTFFFSNVDEYITLTNWKGEVYVGKFGNNPLLLNTTGRFVNEYERVSVDIEFQGVKIHG